MCVLCQASVIEADGSRRDYYPFGAKPLAPVLAPVSSSSRVASAAVQPNAANLSLHFVFTTDCTPYQNWQSQLLVHTAKAVGEQALLRTPCHVCVRVCGRAVALRRDVAWRCVGCRASGEGPHHSGALQTIESLSLYLCVCVCVCVFVCLPSSDRCDNACAAWRRRHCCCCHCHCRS